MKTALAILLLGLSAAPAAAQYTGSIPHPRLRSEVTVSGEIVRIDDLVENAGMAGNKPIFRAPDLGQTGTVPARQILDAVRPYGLIAVDLRGLSEVSVTRAGRMIASRTAQGRAAMAKRRDPSSSGPKAVRPARIAGKAEAQPITVPARARTVIQSNFRGMGRASEPKDI